MWYVRPAKPQISLRMRISYCQGYWIFRKKWGYLPVHEGYLPVYFKEYCYPPPSSKQASTIHGYFVSATPHTVIRLLLIHSLINVPPICLFSVFGSCFVIYTSVPSLVLQTS